MKKNIPQVSISLPSKHHHLLLKAHRGGGREGCSGVLHRLSSTVWLNQVAR